MGSQFKAQTKTAKSPYIARFIKGARKTPADITVENGHSHHKRCPSDLLTSIYIKITENQSEAGSTFYRLYAGMLQPLERIIIKRAKNTFHFPALLCNPSMATSLLSLVLLLFLSPSPSSAIFFSDAIIDAADVLSDSGYLSMALTLQTVFQTLLLQVPTATVFAPSDSAFVRSGQPPLFLLQYHTSPLRLSLEDLKALPYGTRIPTMLLNRSLIVTTSDVDAPLSINNVTVNKLNVYDAGSLVVYGVDEFFDPSFRIYSDSFPEQCPERNEFYNQDTSNFADIDCFGEASDLLRSRGYSKMAAFMDMQLTGFGDGTSVTVFAPADGSIEEHATNFSDYSVLFRQHVVPAWLPWKVMSGLEAGATLPTFSEDFRIKVIRFGDILALNGVPILFMDLFCCNWLVVHGLDQLVTSSIKQDLKEGSSFSFNDNAEGNVKEGSSFAFNDNFDENASDYGEYSVP